MPSIAIALLCPYWWLGCFDFSADCAVSGCVFDFEFASWSICLILGDDGACPLWFEE